MKRTVFMFSIFICGLLTLASCRYKNKFAESVKRHEKYIDVGTHMIRFVISDLPSDYTIVLESGGGRYSDVYNGIRDTLAKLTGFRVISYDRSGFGESELGPADLVKGLVLIDPMNVNFVDRFGLDTLNALQPYFTDPAEDWQKAGNRMVDNFPFALDKLRGYELPPGIPVFLITAGNPPFDPALWRKCHEEMVMNSPKHKLIIAEGNGHDIMTENPELVLNTIVDLAKTIK